MSNAVRGTSGTQGSGLTAGASSSASRSAPAGGTAFGGVLGAAMSGPVHAAAGTGDGKGKGKSDGKGNDTQTAESDNVATLTVADLASTVGKALANAAAASGAGGDSTPIAAGTTGRSDKKRSSDTGAPDPTQAAQAAALVASLASPAANGTPAPVPAGAGRAATVGAAVSISSATGGSQNARAMIPSLLARGAGMPSDHELVGPEDGTGSQEPDGSDPATAMVGRPAAMASAGLDAALAVVPSAPNSVSTAADTASASASGSLDNQPAVPTVTGTASSTTASAPTLVLAALASSERDPSRTPPANGGDGTTLGTVSTITTPLGVTIANVLPSAAPGASIAANNNINVVTADGSSQPLATALSSQMLTMVAAGRNQVTVHLSPPDLGTLTVHVEVQSRDVSAWFASPQPQVQQAVNDALAQLHGSLSGAGLNLASAWVGADVSGGGNGRPTATPLPIRRAPAAPGRADANVAGATSVEGLSVYA